MQNYMSRLLYWPLIYKLKDFIDLSVMSVNFIIINNKFHWFHLREILFFQFMEESLMSIMYSRLKIESQLVSNQKLSTLNNKSIKLRIPEISNSEHQSRPRKRQILPKPNKLKQTNEKISNAQKRHISLPPLKYKFLEQIKHQISALDWDILNVYKKYPIL